MATDPELSAPPTVDQVRRFVRETAEPAQVGPDDPVPTQLHRQVTELGLLRLTLPAEFGGHGLSTPEYQPLLEAASEGPSWLRMLTHVGNGFWRPLAQFGSPPQRELIRGMAGGRVQIAFALTERSGGTGRDLHSTAVRDGMSWLISGEKHLITFADTADFFLLTVATDDRGAADSLTTFVVSRDTPGLNIDVNQHTMGLAGTGHGVLTYDNMRVDDANRLGEVGDGLPVGMSFLDYSRISLATCMVGLAQRALDEAVEYASQRRTFGKPIAARQAIQVRLAQMQTDVAAGRALVRDAGRRHADGEEITGIAAVAKLFCQQMIGRVTDHALQVHGGIGYTTEQPIERIYRDARGFWFEEGTAEVQQLVVARNLLTGGM